MFFVWLLFADGLVGQHGDDQLQQIGFAHMGILFAQAKHPLLVAGGGDPGGQFGGLVGFSPYTGAKKP